MIWPKINSVKERLNICKQYAKFYLCLTYSVADCESWGCQHEGQKLPSKYFKWIIFTSLHVC